ncbi:MAG: DUF2007 domain-containing protein [Proteobacteria bacterium]|uniref:DUF2007 domain-containing protein n=1 Tax=Rudaea sp. TaxID=2136325 RepID=UPI001DA8FB3A|nr:DUF2007 domain-containing protein [Pseudomonadota bacterium]MBS0567523.1 DUF2007 domain-containing protein [Pseudomonadota bacterium]
MKIVYRAENIIDANLVRNALADDGISAYVGGHYLTGAAGELPVSGLVNVMVAPSDWLRARAIAERIDAALVERRADPGYNDDWAADAV